jgi:uncharacterized phage protein (TIGR02220 family)
MGCEGVGIYWCLVEMLYEEGGSLRLSDVEIYAKALNTTSDNIQKTLSDFNLFVKNKTHFYSTTLTKRLKHINAKREKASTSAKLSHSANAERTHSEGSAIKESKVKESKVKEIKDIVGDLNQVLNSSYKPTSSKNRELIEARLAEGFTVEDFKVVHRKMAKAWGIDNKMRQFLRPITLYSNKFESYLNRPEDIRQLTTQQQSNLKQLQELRTESKDDKSIV